MQAMIGPKWGMKAPIAEGIIMAKAVAEFEVSMGSMERIIVPATWSIMETMGTKISTKRQALPLMAPALKHYTAIRILHKTMNNEAKEYNAARIKIIWGRSPDNRISCRKLLI